MRQNERNRQSIMRENGWIRAFCARVVCCALCLIVCGTNGEASNTESSSGTPRASDFGVALQPRMVKIYGVGGFANLEEYQSGFFISDDGLIATAFSTVLDEGRARCVSYDGARFDAEIVGVDPVLEIAILKIERATPEFFNLAQGAAYTRGRDLFGEKTLAFSNLFNVAVGNEPVSIQEGRIAALTTLSAARGSKESRYKGEIFTLDVATNNPGAAGGALVSADGENLLGMLGKELQHARTHCWLNYAIPSHVLYESIQAILSGKPATLEASKRTRPEKGTTLEEIGLGLIPNIFAKTPPYVDWIQDDSRCARAGVLADDLILYINDTLVQSIDEVRSELEFVDFEDDFRLTILRNEEIFTLRVE
ncbi:MAG: S1C family serine protease [Planctomycetia bacterium]|nr:S1C family serine protease [Planctomycetia bacterium]